MDGVSLTPLSLATVILLLNYYHPYPGYSAYYRPLGDAALHESALLLIYSGRREACRIRQTGTQCSERGREKTDVEYADVGEAVQGSPLLADVVLVSDDDDVFQLTVLVVAGTQRHDEVAQSNER